MKFKEGDKVYSRIFQKVGSIIKLDIMSFDLNSNRKIWHLVHFESDVGIKPHKESELIDSEVIKSKLWKALS